MSRDDENEGGPGECPDHEWQVADVHPADHPSGGVGLGLEYECRWCGATRYEASNFDRFPDTNGLDPVLYPDEVARLRRRRRR